MKCDMITKGQKINDRYQIVKSIGEGGMANVYLAYDTILERHVAVKVLRGDLATDEKFVRRFQREALSASSLSHPNIVEVYDVGEDNGIYYIVMEYIEGKHLKQLIKKRGKLTTEEVIDIMLQITDGIACAHDSYIIHRDIKPQNIMILDNGIVKITDFGIAVASNSESLTQTNSVMGSVHYLPPEQANGTGSTVRSDIYSLGIMMFEMLTGKVPFKGETAVEIAIKQLKEPLPSISMYRDDIPQSVENIILKACAKNPENRYANVTEMLYDLDHCLDQDHLHDRKYIYKYPEKVVVKDIENEVKETKKEEKIEAVQKEYEDKTEVLYTNEKTEVEDIAQRVSEALKEDNPITLTNFEEDQERTAIISIDELMEKAKELELIDDDEHTGVNYLEKYNLEPAEVDKVVSDTMKTEEKEVKAFKVSQVISPVYGIKKDFSDSNK